MSETKKTGFTQEQELAARIIADLYPHNKQIMQRESDALKESIRFAHAILEIIKREF